VLVSKSAEIKSITGGLGDVEPGEIRTGSWFGSARADDLDLVTVAGKLRQLGFVDT
jgi:hypothetical protein